MRVSRLQLCFGLFCSVVLFVGCYGKEEPAKPDKPVVQDMKIETPEDEEKIPMQ